MEIELHDLLQEYCTIDFKNRKFTYSVAQSKFIFYLFGKKKSFDIRRTRSFR